ncbi:MAG: hypothetical protein QW360_00105 [Thermofilum sp.]|uniref:Uncharacterized protein n=2 Tax=Thermofilum adornatum TaxID=1365176 RepID=S5ZLD8_9CREN|nr:hypothetical protein [Thermofilum adornatum]AGT35436.1 hypothetical protein N186_05455 [Thermofilum adornatum]AJB41237.1 hypothetical protein TCARB_0159 [Thermofilum adornatum 1505]
MADYMGEKTKPSKTLLIVTFIPIILNVLVFIVTDGFNVHPHLTSPFIYLIGSFVMLVIATFVAFIGYTMAKDEEPEWGSKLQFKIIQALNLLWVLLSIVFALMLVFVYLLRVA